MKTKYEKITKHIRRINELLGVQCANQPIYRPETITIDTLKALLESEDNSQDRAYTSNAVDAAVRDRTEADF